MNDNINIMESAKQKEERKIALEFKNVSKRFPKVEREAVCDVSLSVMDGEFVTILGTSGSGKTTLMKMVNQLYDITEGDILFYGSSITKLEPVEYRRKIGYVVQQGGLFPHMTVEDNIGVVPGILKWDKQRISNRVEELLNMVGLEPSVYRKRFPRQLSGGQQQRVGIARAMAADPAVMLMDEPFGAIDAITRETLQSELIHLHKTMKKTILFVTHDIHEAFKLGDKVIIMHEGKLQQFDDPNRIMLHPANEFVSKLVSADNTMERIKIVTVDAIMTPLSNDSAKAFTYVLDEDTSIEESLTIFMKDKEAVVYVKDSAGDITGQITWEQLSVIVK